MARSELPPGCPGTFGLSIAPGRNKRHWKRDMEADLDFITSGREGISGTETKEGMRMEVIATLLTPGDLTWLQCSDMGEKVQTKPGVIEWIHLPLRDKWVPRDMRLFIKYLHR
jgi:hypothetical protein